jgi:hypothetical protein
MPRGYYKRVPRPPAERFWKHVEKADGDGCWLWTAYCMRSRRSTERGYGVIVINKITVLAHRFSWELHYGPIPGGLMVCHHCDTAACVRPDHLFLGTAEDNVQDAVRKGRVKRGQQRKDAKLTDEEILEIRSWAMAGTDSITTIAHFYGVHDTTITAILRGRTWRHVHADHL